MERFNPEWLFKVPGKIEGPIENVRGEKIVSHALTNVRAGLWAGPGVPQGQRRRRLPRRDRPGAVQARVQGRGELNRYQDRDCPGEVRGHAQYNSIWWARLCRTRHLKEEGHS